MSVKEFDNNFVDPSLSEEKVRFINRIETSIFSSLLNKMTHEVYNLFVRNVCYELGENPTDYIHTFLGQTSVANLKKISNSEFIKTLRVTVAAYSCLPNIPDLKSAFSDRIIDILSKSNLDLGLRWKDGVFYPSGDKKLDDELVDTSLNLLNTYPSEKAVLLSALNNYYGRRFDGVLDKCYLVIEGLARNVLGNSKNLDNNLELLLKSLNFSTYWKAIFVGYLKYANEYARHASSNSHKPNPEEIEAFLYLTCIMVRAMVKVVNQPSGE